MRRTREFRFPKQQRKVFAQATQLVRILVLATSISAVLFYLVKGKSSAMQAAWLESLVTLLPAMIFLITSQFSRRFPSGRFPYGFHRAPSVGYLGGSVVLLVAGAYIVLSSVFSLAQAPPPAIGIAVILGEPLWLGWLMLPVLLYDMIAMSMLGKAMLPLGEQVHDKQLHAIAEMAKADWLSDAAAMVGVIGIGFGIWWLDGVAAIVIGVDVTKDGISNTRRAVEDLMDATPTTVDRKQVESTVPEVAEYLRSLPWVDDASVRMRDEGHAIFGEGFVVPKPGTADLVDKLHEASEHVARHHWKMAELSIVPVRRLPAHLEIEDPPLPYFEFVRERGTMMRRTLKRLLPRVIGDRGKEG